MSHSHTAHQHYLTSHHLIDIPHASTIYTHDFSLADRVGLVTGGNRGIELEMALALVEAGSRVVYCVDLPKKPGDEFTKVREYVSRMQGTGGDARLEYICADVTDQVST